LVAGSYPAVIGPDSAGSVSRDNGAAILEILKSNE
jgi:hypothetical protein